MYCKHCGKEIADDSKFCQHCGGIINSIKLGEPSNEVIFKTKEDSPIRIEISKKGKEKKPIKVNKSSAADLLSAIFYELLILVLIACVCILPLLIIAGLSKEEVGGDFYTIATFLTLFAIGIRYAIKLGKWVENNKSKE